MLHYNLQALIQMDTALLCTFSVNSQAI